MRAMASQIIVVSIVYSTACSGVDQRKQQSFASLVFVRGIHRWPLNSPHKGPVTEKCFHLMTSSWFIDIAIQWMYTVSDSTPALQSKGKDTQYHVLIPLWSPRWLASPFYKIKTYSDALCHTRWPITLRWRHNERDSVSNHQPHVCLLNRLFRRRSKKTSKLRVTGLCVGNSPGTGEFPAQMASYAENVSIWWRHHEISEIFIRPSDPGTAVGNPPNMGSMICSLAWLPRLTGTCMWPVLNIFCKIYNPQREPELRR